MSSGINYLSDALDTRKIREDALRRMAQGTVSPYARRSDPSGLCSVPDPFAGGVGYPAVRGYRYEGYPAAGTAGKGGFNLADFGKELLTGFVAGGLSSAAFYGAGKAVEAVKGSVRGVGKGGISTSKPNQVHHYATDKSKTYTQAFKNITDKYGLDLDADWNKDLLPHQGRHPNAYHDFVLDEMRNIDNIANGNKDIFLDLYESEIKSIIRDNPDMLYSKYWKEIKE